MLRIALILILPVCLVAQTRDQRWQDDVRNLQTEIIRRHPNPFTKSSRETFGSAVTDLINDVPALTDFQVVAGMAKLVASLGDSHATLRPSITADRSYPLRVRWFPDGLLVMQTDESHIRALGKKIVRIADRSAEEAYLAIRPYISYENDHWARLVAGSNGYLISADLLQAAGVIPEYGPATFTFEEPSGQTFEMRLEPANLPLVAAPFLSRPGNPLYRRNTQQAYWFDVLADSRTLYIKYNQCRDVPALPMAQFTSDVLAAAIASPVDRIVFDLRNNSGGNSSVLLILLNALGEAFLRGAIAPSKGAYAIIGRETFSSASLNTVDLKRNGVVLVGEPTGGGASGFGEVVSFILPNSRVSVSTSTRLFTIADFPGTTIPPDLSVELTTAHFLADQDPVLEAILRQ